MNALRIFRFGLLVGARDFSIFWTWQTWLGGWMVRILTNALIWVFVGRLLGSPEKLNYLLIGSAATAGFGTFAVAAACWDRFDGTYPLLVISPAHLAPAIIGRMAIWMFGWMASCFLTFILLFLLFGIHPGWKALAALPPLIALLSASTFFFSAFLGSFANLVPALRNMIGWVLIFGIMTFCGVSVPVSFWPYGVQLVASVLPVTHGLEAVRLILAHGVIENILIDAGLELLVGVGWLILAVLTFNRFAEHGRADGSIEFA